VPARHARRHDRLLTRVDPSPAFDAFPTRRRAVIILVLGGVWSLGSFATDLFLPAMPAAATALGASDSAVALNITAVLVGLGIGQLLAGPVSDSRGRRPVLLAGLVVFTAAALVCVLAPGVEVLVVVRLIQGMAAAFGVAISNAVVTDYKRGRDAARMLSWMVVIGGVVPIVASVSGAQMLRLLGWTGPFFLLAGIGLLFLVFTAVALPESLPRERRVTGGVRSSIGVVGGLSRDRVFLGYAFTAALAYATFFAYLSGSSFVYQHVYGISPTTYSLLFAVNSLGMLATGRLNHRLLERYAPARLLAVALAANALAGTGVLIAALYPGLGLWAMEVPMFVIVATLGVIYPDLTALALSLHPEVAGTAAAYFGTLRLGLGAAATLAIGVGGAVTATAVAIEVVASALAALALFAAVSRHIRRQRVLLDLPEEASSDVPPA
jgi:DHA1 family bicyclomycin/chloramphenicol resistance-like MFS transporter